METAQTLGETIKNARVNFRLSQTALAQLCGCCINTICFTEYRPDYTPLPATLYLLAQHLNLDFKNLLELAGYSFDPNHMSFKIMFARLEQGLSLRQLSHLCGLSEAILSHIELGQTQKIQPANFVKLCEVLNIDLFSLLEDYYGDSMSLGTMIKIARISKGLTQNELAKLCGISSPTIVSIERNPKKKCSQRILLLLSKHLDLSLERLEALNLS